MEENIHIKILPKYSLVIEYFHGDITIDNIIQAKRIKNSLPNFNPNYNHLIDLREANFLFNHENINTLALFQQENKEFIKPRKSAFITSKPEHVSLSILFTLSMKKLPIDFEIFTLLRAALNWLDLWEMKERFYEDVLAQIVE